MTAKLVTSLRYRNASRAIHWLCDTLGFERRMVVPGPNGSIAHAQLTLGDGMVMLSSAGSGAFDQLQVPATEAEPVTQSVYVVVADADAVHAAVVAAGADVVMPLEDAPYGGRGFSCRDPEGQLWNVGTYDPYLPEPLFHITSVKEAAVLDAAQTYFPLGFEAEGFTHCSLRYQVLMVANQRFHGRADLVLLEIDRTKIRSRWVMENTEGGDEAFPHIYDGLSPQIVVARHPFPCRSDGSFELPETLR